MNVYQPFVEDSKHLSELDRQRSVVLRVPSPAAETFLRVQETVRERLASLPVSYPVRAHVTLSGFAAGTDLAAVQDLVGAWARSMPPLSIAAEGPMVFPPPFQVVAVQVRKTPELFAGHYGGVAIDASGRLHATWGEGEPEYRTGGVWVNSVDLADALRR